MPSGVSMSFTYHIAAQAFDFSELNSDGQTCHGSSYGLMLSQDSQWYHPVGNNAENPRKQGATCS